MKGKSFIALFAVMCVVMLTAESALAGLGGWMPTLTPEQMAGQMWYMEQQKKKEQEQLHQQLQLERARNRQREEYLEVELYAERVKASKTELMKAAESGTLQEVQNLIRSGADVNARTYYDPMLSQSCSWSLLSGVYEGDRATALSYAIRRKENVFEVVKALLDAGAEVDSDILQTAVSGENNEVLRLILSQKIDKDALSSVLTYAKNSGVIRMLTEAGADINHKNSYGKTLLMDSAELENANPDFVKDLINIGANVNAINDDGKTPLMYAARDGSSSVVKVLLEAGAYVNTVDNSRKTALMYAAEKNTPDVVNVLLDAGAKIDMKDEDGRKAVDYAKPAYFGWDGGNPKLKDSSAFKRLGESDIWFKSIW